MSAQLKIDVCSCLMFRITLQKLNKAAHMGESYIRLTTINCRNNTSDQIFVQYQSQFHPMSSDLPPTLGSRMQIVNTVCQLRSNKNSI